MGTWDTAEGRNLQGEALTEVWGAHVHQEALSFLQGVQTPDKSSPRPGAGAALKVTSSLVVRGLILAGGASQMSGVGQPWEVRSSLPPPAPHPASSPEPYVTRATMDLLELQSSVKV